MGKTLSTSRLEKYYNYLFALLIFSIPFSSAISNIVLIILGVLFIITFNKKWIVLYCHSPFFYLFLLIIYIYINNIIRGSFTLNIDFLSRLSYLILIPILFTRVNNVELLKKISIITFSTILFISIIKIINFKIKFNYFPFSDSWATNVVLVLERPYTGIVCLILIILLFEQMKKNAKLIKYLYFVFILITLVFLFFISIRISIITLFVLSFIYLFVYNKYSLYKKALIFFATICFFLVSIYFNKNISKRFFLEKNIKELVNNYKEKEPRIIIWDCAFEVTKLEKFSLIFGVGSQDLIKNFMTQCYGYKVKNESRNKWFLERKFNTHNQYLGLFLIGGLISVLVLTIFLFSYIKGNSSNFFSIAVILSFIIMMIVENIFYRQFGCLLFTIFTSLFYNPKKIE